MIARTKELQLSPEYVIEVSKPFHVSWWAATLGVTEQELVEAVSATGVRAVEVCRYLRKECVISTERYPPRRLRNRPGAEERSRELSGKAKG